jgi:hypothetical protein
VSWSAESLRSDPAERLVSRRKTHPEPARRTSSAFSQKALIFQLVVASSQLPLRVLSGEGSSSFFATFLGFVACDAGKTCCVQPVIRKDRAMNEQSQPKPAPYHLQVLIGLRRFCGPPPLLRSENIEACDTMLFRLIEALQPNNFVEGLFIKHIADYEWQIIRYNRHHILLMERGHRQRIKAAAQNKQAQVRSESADAAHAALKEIEASMLKSPPTEADYAEALERAIEYAERLDTLLNTAIVRRDRSLEQLLQYREARRAHGFTTITNYQRGASEREMREEFAAIAAQEREMARRLQAEAPSASPNSQDNQVEPPPASSDT